MINNNTNYREIFYSPYGYIEIAKADYSLPSSLVHFKKHNFFNGTINKSQLTKTIKVQLKTFYGQRQKFLITVQIDSTLSNLIQTFLPTDPQFNPSLPYRLILTSHGLKELNLYNTYIDENIKDNAMIILIPPEKIKFSLIDKSEHIYLDNKKKTAIKMDNDNIEFCLLYPGFKYGKRFIEFTLDAEPIERNIIIGVSVKREDYMFNKSKGFYGFVLSECQLVFNVNEQEEKLMYGQQMKYGDKVGMLIDLSKNIREIKYYINNIAQGTAFRNIPNEVIYPCVALGFQGTKISVKSIVNFPPD